MAFINLDSFYIAHRILGVKPEYKVRWKFITYEKVDHKNTHKQISKLTFSINKENDL